MKRKLRVLRAEEPCGCGSGVQYRHCCKKKKFKFHVNGKGEIVRSLKVAKPLEIVLEDGRQRFKAIFGRSLQRSDLILFEQYLEGEEDRWQIIKATADSAKIREELIFSWRRSGFIVAENSFQIMPDNDLEEWKDAMREYKRLKRVGVDPFHVFTYLDAHNFEYYKNCESLIRDSILIGFSVADRSRNRIGNEADLYQILMLLSALNSCRTVFHMFNSRYDDDCLAVIRGVYEQYLRIKLLRLEPEQAKKFDASVLVKLGKYSYKTRKDGSLDPNVVVDPATGQEINIRISNRYIIGKSDIGSDRLVYENLYDLLSERVHHDIAEWAIKSSILRDVSVDREQDKIFACILYIFIIVMLFTEIFRLNFLVKQTKRDIRYFVSKCKKALLPLLTAEEVLSNTGIPEFFASCLEEYVEIIK